MRAIGLLFLLCITSISTAQESRYWIFLSDKITDNYNYEAYLSADCIENRKNKGISLYQYSDIPVNNNYVQALRETGAEVENKSRWFNAIAVTADTEELEQIKELGFVEGVRVIRHYMIPAAVTGTQMYDLDALFSVHQMQLSAFQKAEISGKGVRVGIIDAGFKNADSSHYFKHVFSDNRVKAFKDFIDGPREDFWEAKTKGDSHGASVWKMVGGILNKDSLQIQIGMAPDADFYLARTENGDKEHRVEEDDWIAAIEWMDSLGVQLVNTSLGYSDAFDKEEENYTPKQMDGHTTVISKGATMAVEEKGIFVVVSAGNQGNDPFRVVASPGDAEASFTIGATSLVTKSKIGYSSIGTDYTPFLKPNVSCFSSSGTSFSAPAVTGFVACMMQLMPNASNEEIRSVIEKSAHLYDYPNNYIGMGVPNAKKAMKIAKGEKVPLEGEVKEIKVKGRKYKWERYSIQDDYIVVFHKKDDTHVICQQLIPTDPGKEMDKEELDLKEGNCSKGKFKIKKLSVEVKIHRPKKAKRTTLQVDDDVLEIIWE